MKLLLTYLILILVVSCETNTKETSNVSSIILTDDDASNADVDATSDDASAQTSKTIVTNAYAEYKNSKEMEYGCYETIFETKIDRLKGKPEEMIFNVDNWTHTLCFTIISNEVSSAQISINNINVWTENDFKKSSPKTITKIIKLPIPFTKNDGTQGSTIKAIIKGKPGSFMTIIVQSSLPKDIEKPAIFTEQ